MSIQTGHYDAAVVDAIKNNRIIVDPDNGIIYGRRLDNSGKRIEIGGISKGRKSKIFGFSIDGRPTNINAARAIWLATHGSVPPGMMVQPIAGDSLSINNLKTCSAKKFYRSWTKEETELLLSNFNKLSWGKIAKMLGRSEKSCRNKLKKLKEHKSKDRKLWTEDEDIIVTDMVRQGVGIQAIAKKLGRTYGSISLRARRFGDVKKFSKMYIRELNKNRFYTALKAAKVRGSAVISCCICGKRDNYKYNAIHHIDGNIENNHIANQATLCPCCHAEVGGGEHNGVKLFAIWRRVYNDGEMGPIETNKELVYYA